MKTLALTAVAILMSSTAMAASVSGGPVTTTVLDSVPAYQNYTTTVPHQVCRDVEVPVYGQKSSSGGNIFGTIIGGVAGGLLGSQIGGGKGNTAATAGGAVAGALFGNHLGGKADQGNNGRVVGYRRENRCTTEYTNQQQSRVIGYDVTVVVHGETKTFRVSRNYRAGDSVRVNTTYTLR